MNITCQHCQTKLTIPDHKLPSSKDTALKCPKCRGKIQIQAVKESPVAGEASVTRPLSFQDRQSALLCVESDAVRKQIQPLLRQMGFNIEIVQDARSALDKMEYHIYHLVLIEDGFDQQQGLSNIIGKMNNLDMSLRRRICLVLISSRFKTNDNMAALHSSVNSIIRREDIVHLDAFLLKVLAEHRQFYTVYNDSLRQAGKA
jgi:predicted Zn finger-like uncharacterized protein